MAESTKSWFWNWLQWWWYGDAACAIMAEEIRSLKADVKILNEAIGDNTQEIEALRKDLDSLCEQLKTPRPKPPIQTKTWSQFSQLTKEGVSVNANG